MLKVAKKDMAKLPGGGSVGINFDGKILVRKDGAEILLHERDLDKITLTHLRRKDRISK